VFGFVRLANAVNKLEIRSISHVYNHVKADKYANDILGGAAMPSFKEWAAKMPAKDLFSYYDGYKALGTFSTSNVEKAKKRAEAQNKRAANK
jgi:hypothetical protein